MRLPPLPRFLKPLNHPWLAVIANGWFLVWLAALGYGVIRKAGLLDVGSDVLATVLIMVGLVGIAINFALLLRADTEGPERKAPDELVVVEFPEAPIPPTPPPASTAISIRNTKHGKVRGNISEGYERGVSVEGSEDIDVEENISRRVLGEPGSLKASLTSAHLWGQKLRDDIPGARASSGLQIGGRPTTDEDVDRWQESVESLLRESGELLNLFLYEPPPVQLARPSLYSADTDPHVRRLHRMNRRLDQLEQVIWRLG